MMCDIMHDEVTDSWFLVMPEVLVEKLQTKLTKSSGKLDEFFMSEWMHDETR